MESGSFMVIDADEVLAHRAGELAQKYQLKGADALILASAERVRAPFLFTWDKGLTKVGSQMRGLTVCVPDSPDYKHQSSRALREMGGESAPRRSTRAPARTWIPSMRPACARRSRPARS